MITEAALEDALSFLASTDEPCASLKADTERAEMRAKKKKAAVFEMTDGTVADRNAASEVSSEYQSALEDYFKALQAYSTMQNRRATKVIVIDVWRSQEASKRMGHV